MEVLEFPTPVITVWKKGRAGVQLRLTYATVPFLKDKKRKSKTGSKVRVWAAEISIRWRPEASSALY